MRCFVKNLGLLFIIGGGVLLAFFTTQNRIENIHFIIAGLAEILGLAIYITTNRFLKDPNDQC